MHKLDQYSEIWEMIKSKGIVFPERMNDFVSNTPIINFHAHVRTDEEIRKHGQITSES